MSRNGGVVRCWDGGIHTHVPRPPTDRARSTADRHPAPGPAGHRLLAVLHRAMPHGVGHPLG